MHGAAGSAVPTTRMLSYGAPVDGRVATTWVHTEPSSTAPSRAKPPLPALWNVAAKGYSSQLGSSAAGKLGSWLYLRLQMTWRLMSPQDFPASTESAWLRVRGFPLPLASLSPQAPAICVCA